MNSDEKFEMFVESLKSKRYEELLDIEHAGCDVRYHFAVKEAIKNYPPEKIEQERLEDERAARALADEIAYAREHPNNAYGYINSRWDAYEEEGHYSKRMEEGAFLEWLEEEMRFKCSHNPDRAVKYFEDLSALYHWMKGKHASKKEIAKGLGWSAHVTGQRVKLARELRIIRVYSKNKDEFQLVVRHDMTARYAFFRRQAFFTYCGDKPHFDDIALYGTDDDILEACVDGLSLYPQKEEEWHPLSYWKKKEHEEAYGRE